MKIDVTVADRSGWERVQEEVKTHGATQVSRVGVAGLKALSSVEVQFSTSTVPLASVTGQIIYLNDAIAAVSFAPAERAILSAVIFPLSKPEAADPSSASGEEAPLWKRYKEMSKSERIKLARHGKGEALRLVLKDKDKSLHTHVLKNPKLSGRELASFIRGGSMSPNLLKQIGQTTDLLRKPAVVEALVVNPNTPIKTAVNLVPRMKLSVAKRISKTNNARGPVLAAIRRRLAKR